MLVFIDLEEARGLDRTFTECEMAGRSLRVVGITSKIGKVGQLCSAVKEGWLILMMMMMMMGGSGFMW